ncbi:serine/threonine-protein kinase ULK1 isoform X2 [Salmo salar]|uniref:non-specific serine/threonine protein kinase n=1 Tax=Salmo salar TaxID=8030 RepID=A0A1S3NK22_SALSA|nr:serine/threonine-protein kinase ULK1a isoform X2 [Salmo salar]|eukprot:XP_014015757.1 PREDICTED: serine/threonine-protein kinase ULK1-like isoform X2 [Salmo salar]
METIGKFEFNRKDLIGHGAFAVVFKGRHKERHDLEVAVKCINKKNLAKSHSLLGKEIKILKELKHENIVGLLDFQEMAGCVYLVMEYCNGGDLAEYLHSKATLSEDTIRIFLQQIAGAMKVLKEKGILHRDLKPQNILLCHPEGRKSSPNNTCIKIADFGFARHLQCNTMAATLCGSPMYMAPEVIMSQNYDAKADLWSIGTIVYQCLTGKAPFQASSPQELRLFYERNRDLQPSIPRETSVHLRHLLLGLLQRNHKERMDFDEFFHHSFLESSSSTKKSSPVPMPSYPSSGSASSSSSSSTFHLASSPQHSDAVLQRLQPKAEPTPSRDTVLHYSRNTSSETDDFVMVPAQFPNPVLLPLGEITCDMGDGSPIQGSMLYSGSSLLAAGVLGSLGRTPPPSSPLCPPNPVSRPAEFNGSNYSQSVPIPVPTQIHNYQRIEQNLHPAGLHGSTRATLCCVDSSSGSSPGSRKTGASLLLPSGPGGAVLSHRRLSAGGARPYQPSPQVGTIPETPEQTGLFSTWTGQQSPQATPPHEFPRPNSFEDLPIIPTRTRTVSDLSHISRATGKRKGPFKRSLSAGRLSDMLLKAAFGAQLLDGGSNESLYTERSMDTTAPTSGALRVAGTSASGSPTSVVFTGGSPSRGNAGTPPNPTRTFSVGSPSYVSPSWSISRGTHRDVPNYQHLTHPMTASPDRAIDFDPPELPEETLMGQWHTDGLRNLRFTLAFVHCVMEIASSKDTGLESETSEDALDVSFLQQSLVADQISLLSREWGYAEQLVLYMKAAEYLSSALHTAMEDIREGRLFPSSTVKQVMKKMNELYKSSVTSCRSLNARLQSFLLNKQRLMDHMSNITAEKLIYSHTVTMVQSAALDEMFHRGQAPIQRYHKALLLMEGLSLTITEQADIDNISKCKQCIERRLLSALQTVQCD